MKIGIADTTFARSDMAKTAIDELRRWDQARFIGILCQASKIYQSRQKSS